MMRKLIIWTIVIAVAWLWGSVIFNSCNKNKKENQHTAVVNTPVAEEDEEDIATTDIEDEHDDRAGDRGVTEEEMDEAEEEGMGEGEDEADMDEEEDEMEDDEEEAPAKPIDIIENSVKGGKYIIVAGAFRSRDNAKSMLKRLQRLGYEDAELVKFDYDEHHAICVGRYESLSAAKSVSRDLKNDHGVENYVHERRFKKKR